MTYESSSALPMPRVLYRFTLPRNPGTLDRIPWSLYSEPDTRNPKPETQRNCASTQNGRLLCACLADPFFVGPTSSNSYVEVYAANENDVTPLSEAAVGGLRFTFLRSQFRVGVWCLVFESRTCLKLLLGRLGFKIEGLGCKVYLLSSCYA